MPGLGNLRAAAAALAFVFTFTPPGQAQSLDRVPPEHRARVRQMARGATEDAIVVGLALRNTAELCRWRDAAWSARMRATLELLLEAKGNSRADITNVFEGVYEHVQGTIPARGREQRCREVLAESAPMLREWDRLSENMAALLR